MDLHIRTVSGAEATPFIRDLARLRIQVFREFPYLYDGDMAYEEQYLATFIAAPDSVLVIAFDSERVIGIATGMPMEHETENIRTPWEAKHYNPKKIFYYGESVLEKSYRGRGIGVRFFEEREQWAVQLGRFDRLTFCRVMRPIAHPLQPADYQPLDNFWRKRGFQPTDGITCLISWKDLNREEESEKSLHFWEKVIV